MQLEDGVAGAEVERTTCESDTVREHQAGARAESRIERSFEAPRETVLLLEDFRGSESYFPGVPEDF